MANIYFILGIFLYPGVPFTESFHSESYVEITQLIRNYGYAVEVHEVITEDGFILENHRIPGAINEELNGRQKEKVALLIHGLIGSSASWVISGPNRSMAFYLVDKGYDVWLINNRGNTYSSKHVSKSEKSYGFWDFSWHEMGVYDLPATIDYVLSNTNKNNLHLVCFSQGCTETFVMGSLKPEYNEKIKFLVALSPTVYTTQSSGLLSILSSYSSIIGKFIDKVGYFPILRASRALRTFTGHFCRLGSPFQEICISVIFLVIGPGYDELDREKLAFILNYEPAGSSIKQVAHFGYGKFYPGTFRQYPYDTRKNLEVYNSTNPPDYPIKRNNYPIAIYHGSSDVLTPPADVATLVENLPNVVEKYLVPGEKLNHYDFVFGRNIRQLVYIRAVELMENYNQQS